MRKHRVEVDHLRRLTLPGPHALDGIARQQAHALDNPTHLKIAPRPRQAILEQRGNQWLALDQRHLAAQAGQHERILAKPRSGIQYLRPNTLGDTDRLGDHLPAAAAVQAPMRRLPLDEVHPHRPGCLWPQLLDLQAIDADLHGKAGLVVDHRQAQPLRPCLGLRLELRGQCLDPDTCALLLLCHPFPHSKKINETPATADTRSIRYSARAQRARLPCQILSPSA